MLSLRPPRQRLLPLQCASGHGAVGPFTATGAGGASHVVPAVGALRGGGHP
jgi:hypothetical protein